jgi:hypothetical protein
VDTLVRLSCRLPLCLATLLVVGAAVRGEAATSLSIAWDQNPKPEVTGYVVHVGTTPGVYTQAIDVGPATTFLYEPVVPGQQYCFAVSAYFDRPVHGPSSAEVCGYGDQAPLLMAPGNLSSVIRDWTLSSTLTWTPTTADAAYRITVWVKNADSVTTAWDGSASMPFGIQ